MTSFAQIESIGEVGRIGRVNNSKVELRLVGGWVGGGCNDDFRDRSDFVDCVNISVSFASSSFQYVIHGFRFQGISVSSFIVFAERPFSLIFSCYFLTTTRLLLYLSKVYIKNKFVWN